ncbi:MAG: AAA family ATPase [Gammaproteobacteria bacterium]|nr:MAG: AAA family ATPase [Gammaproteobacteria bacterium]
MRDQHDLGLILESRVPLVVVETHDENRFLKFLTQVIISGAVPGYRPLFSWSVTNGLQRLDIEMDPQPTNAAPDQALRHIRAVDKPGIYVLLDMHPYLEDPLHVRLLKDIALRAGDLRQTLILVSHALSLPAELQPYAARFEMRLPDDAERAQIVTSVVDEWNAEHGGNVRIDQHAFDLLVRNLAGLTRTDTQRLARNAVYDDGVIDVADLPEATKAKYALLGTQGVLSFEYETAMFSDVGGLSRLKVWLEQRKRVMEQGADKPQLDPPRGLLLLGVQGCGKSLAAKATAGILGVPLLRLDVGSLYNKFHGETERNLRESLQQAEVMAPCVLWLDEIEKALATGAGDDGLSRRILGTFLTWLAEKQASVFVVATANDISQLPPELVRKGRFDEIFFVDLPSPRVRMDIFQIHLRQRELDPQQFDLVQLVEASDGFSGAEIEQAIVAALYAAHALNKQMDTAYLLAECRRSRPLSVLMAEKLQALRAWAADRTVAAD